MKDLSDKIINNLKTIRSWSSGVKSELLSRKDRPEIPITSLPNLNYKLWGLIKGLTVVASRTSQGKSSWVTQVCYDTAKYGIPTLLLSLEDDVPTIIEKIFCQQKFIDNEELLHGHFNRYQDKWDEFIENFPKELLITNEIGSTFEEINFLLTSLSPKPKVVCVDYLQNIKITNKSERERYDEYIRQFRQICLENGIAGMLVSQMNRMAGGVDGVISLENLKSTGGLEEKSERVILLDWPYFHSHNEAQKNEYIVIIAKNKRGRTGKHILHYTPEHYRFNEVAPKEEILPYKDE